MTQLSISARGPYTAAERVLATTIAGYVYPGRGSFQGLRKAEQEACLAAARLALELAETK